MGGFGGCSGPQINLVGWVYGKLASLTHSKQDS